MTVDQNRFRALISAGVDDSVAKILADSVLFPYRTGLVLTPASTPAQFLSALADETIDDIEFSGGTYTWAPVTINVERKRPVTIRPAPGQTVVFSGALCGTSGQFYLGLGGVARNLWFEFELRATFDGYAINQTGIVWIGNAHNCKFNRARVRNSHASVSATTSWCLYISHDNNVGATHFEGDGWDVDGGARTLSGWQITGAPAKDHVSVRGWLETGMAYAGYVTTNGTNVLIEGHQGSNCGVAGDAMYFENNSAVTVLGTIRNNRFTLSDGLRNLSAMTDGGGNSFSGTAQPFYLLDQATQAPGTTLPGAGGLQGDGDKSGAIANTNKAMTLTPGLGQQGYAIATLATVSTQNLRMARFILDRPLQAQTIAAQNIRLHGGISQDNADANARLAFQLFVWRPSTGVKVGNLVTGPRDATAITDTVEHAVATNAFTSSALAVLAGDLLVLEVWINAAQGTAAIRNDTIWFSGARPDSAVDNAAYLDIPTGLLLA